MAPHLGDRDQPAGGQDRSSTPSRERWPSPVIAWTAVAGLAYGVGLVLALRGGPATVELDAWRLLCGVAGIVGIVGGVRRNRPADRWPWWMLAVLVGAWLLDPLARLVLDVSSESSLVGWLRLVEVSLSAFAYLAALALFLRHRGLMFGGGAALDVMIVLATYGCFLWYSAVGPGRPDPPSLPHGLAEGVVLPLSMLAVLLLTMCLGFVDEIEIRSYSFLAACATTYILPNLVIFLALSPSVGTEAVADTVPLTIFLLCAAAWDPSMRQVSEPMDSVRTGGGVARSLVVGSSFAIPFVAVLAVDGPTVPDIFVAPTLVALAGVALTHRARRAVDELVLAEQASRRAASTDALTGLCNRRGFVDVLSSAVDRGDDVGVVFLDLDRFKLFNDVHGHSAGDDLLRCAGERIARVAGAWPAARIGGDEFAVAFGRGTTDLSADGRLLGERLLEVLTQPLDVNGRLASLGASIGVAELRSPEVLGPGAGPARATGAVRGLPAALDLLRRADLAQYRAKSIGGGQVVSFSEDLDREVTRGAWVIDSLRSGDRFLGVVFQAIVRTADGAVVGAEALARLTTPEVGPIPPAEFIPAAERSGLIIPVGRRVLELVVAEIGGCRHRLPPGFRVSLNVSPLQLEAEPGTTELELLAAADPEVVAHLRVELTETALATDVSRTAIERLSALGYQIAIDDFGSDYASLQYLSTMHVDVLKLDRSFVARALDLEGVDAAIIRHVVELSGEFGVEVVAEGVESDDQAELLARLGCSFGQGYHWDRPSPGLARLVGDATPSEPAGRAQREDAATPTMRS